MPTRRPMLVLAVLDGWGLSKLREGNAIAQARLPTLDAFYSRYPWVPLEASGNRVGLPPGQMGNSEVGHLNIGAGRVVHQDIIRIQEAIESGEFFRCEAIREILEVARERGLHLMGLVSDGGVHSHLDHLIALLRFARQEGVGEVFIHAFTDGRDTSPTGGVGYLRKVFQATQEIGLGRIASVSGRYFAMDRDHRWERTEKSYRAIVEGLSEMSWADPLEGVQRSYREAVTDEFVLPFAVVDESGKPVGRIHRDQAVIFFNFRADRARQLTRALVAEEFDGFTRVQPPTRYFLTMKEYDSTLPLPVAFSNVPLERTLVKVLAQHNVRNLRMAETEKYAHVTYFFNGGEETPFPCEHRQLIPSPKVPTYDQKPEMSALEITDRLLVEMGKAPETVILNFANADMVGHTGVLGAATQAAEVVDTCLGRIHQKLKGMGGVMMVTADHGNAEQMIDPDTGEVHTAHTSNPVPFILADEGSRGCSLRRGGALEDIAPTLLDYLEIEKPPEMTGRSLLLVE